MGKGKSRIKITYYNDAAKKDEKGRWFQDRNLFMNEILIVNRKYGAS